MNNILWGLAALAPVVALAEPRVIAVQGADVAVVASIEARLAREADVTLVPGPFQTEALALARMKAGELSDPKRLAQFSRLLGVDVVVLPGKADVRVCEAASSTCKSVPPAELFKTLGLTTAPEEPAHPGHAAYAACRAQALSELHRIVLRGETRPAGKALVAPCEKSGAANPGNTAATATLLSARALATDSEVEEELGALLASLPGDGLAATVYTYLVSSRPTANLGEVIAAEKLAEKTAPRALEVVVAIAETHFRADDFEPSVAWFRKALALAPRSPYVLARLSYALHSQGDDEAAVKLAAEADRLTGGEVVAYRMEHASRLVDVKRFTEAESMLRALHDADPTWGRAALRYGWALHVQGKIAEAIPLFEKAASSKARTGVESGDRRIAQLDLAQAYARTNRTGDALSLLETMKKEKGVFEPELADKDFDAIRAEPRFQKLLTPRAD